MPSEMASRAAPFTRAATISRRSRPNVRSAVAGRWARERRRAATSASMCPASASRASEWASHPPTASTSMTAAVMPSTTASRRRLSWRSGARCVHCTSNGSAALTRPSFLVPRPSKYPAVPPPGNTPYVPASMAGPVSESLGLRLLAVVALVLANAFFVAAEFALVAARRTRIEAMVRRGDRKARTVQAALQDLYRQLSAAQLGITVASILLGYVSEDTVAHLFREWFAALPPLLDFLTRGGVASTVAVAVVSFLHVVFGEQAPKAWAI